MSCAREVRDRVWLIPQEGTKEMDLSEQFYPGLFYPGPMHHVKMT